MKLTETLTFVCFFLLLVVMSQATVAEDFPTELRVVANCLADSLYPDLDEAMKERHAQEIRVEMQTHKFDLAKIKSDNEEIQHLANEALTAVSDASTRLETIDNLPKPNNWNTYGAVFLDGFLIGAGSLPTGASVASYQSEAAKQAAIDSELKGLLQTIKKLEIAQRLLPRVVKPYAATETKSKNGDRMYIKVHEYPCFGDTFYVANNGNELRDCVLDVKITGAKGDIGKSVFFIEKFERGQGLCCILANGNEFDGEMILRKTAYNIKKAELTLLSPKYSTSIEYEYGPKERDDDYATMFKNVKLTARYSEVTEGFFDNWARSATIYMNGFSRLPPCTLSVTFDGEGKTYSKSDSGWTEGNGWMFYGNNKSEDKCKSISAVVTFPLSNFKIKETWTVNR